MPSLPKSIDKFLMILKTFSDGSRSVLRNTGVLSWRRLKISPNENLSRGNHAVVPRVCTKVSKRTTVQLCLNFS